MFYIVSGLVLLAGTAFERATAVALRSEHLLIIHHRPSARIFLERQPSGEYARRSAGGLPLAVLRFVWHQAAALVGATAAPARATAKRPAAIAVNVKPCA